MRIALGLAVALLVLAAAPGAASASTARTGVTILQGKGCSLVPESCVIVRLFYTAAPGEANDVRLTRDGSSIIVRDTGADIQPQSGCTSQGKKAVRCSPPEGPSTGIIEMNLDLGDLADTLDNDVHETAASNVEGGAGDDRLVGGNFRDTLGGGAGRDQLQGRGGFDLLGDGAGGSGLEPDALDGGDGIDRVSYGRRTKRVFVNLTPGAMSGEAGENDTLSNLEIGWGGKGPDVMRAGATAVSFSGRSGNDQLVGGFGKDILYGESGDDKIDGGFGNDRVEGDKGNDRLRGGCDSDKVFGESGRDRIFDADGSRDRLNGGSDRDFAEFDQLDGLKSIESRRFRRIDACAL